MLPVMKAIGVGFAMIPLPATTGDVDGWMPKKLITTTGGENV